MPRGLVDGKMELLSEMELLLEDKCCRCGKLLEGSE